MVKLGIALCISGLSAQPQSYSSCRSSFHASDHTWLDDPGDNWEIHRRSTDYRSQTLVPTHRKSGLLSSDGHCSDYLASSTTRRNIRIKKKEKKKYYFQGKYIIIYMQHLLPLGGKSFFSHLVWIFLVGLQPHLCLDAHTTPHTWPIGNPELA